MLIRGLKRYLNVVIPLLIVAFVTLSLYGRHLFPQQFSGSRLWPEFAFSGDPNVPVSEDITTPKHTSNTNDAAGIDPSHGLPPSLAEIPVPPPPPPEGPPQHLAEGPPQHLNHGPPQPLTETSPLPLADSPTQALEPSIPSQDLVGSSSSFQQHRELFSVSTPDRKYFPIKFGNEEAINPNIIPHPFLEDTWIIVAQHQRSNVKNTVWFAELTCDAAFTKNHTLACIKPPMNLPIPSTPEHHCTGDIFYFGFSIGPHDARMFYGPHNPFVMYGSLSAFTCFGQWLTDLRILLDWGHEFFYADHFRQATELQRPPPYGRVEKNWFVFWDNDDQIYAHHDLYPKRVFTILNDDGTVGEDIAPLSAAHDGKCLSKYILPDVEHQQSTHQATNSLSITLCNRADITCEKNDSNTVLFSIFQRKTFFNWKTAYEPFIMAFSPKPPFELYGISTKPFWFHGRARPKDGKPSDTLIEYSNHTGHDMLYTTSMSWKRAGQKYHGFLDDELFIGFGIEDKDTAGIDVIAGDLFLDLGLCP